MSIPKISLVIPVYNVAPYLESCLDSVLCQTLEPIELICVNDGSTDASPEILARYAAEHENLRIVNQPNGGLSRARNAGLAHAGGEYIFFLDSDDFLLKPDNLERLWELAHRERLDMLRFSGDVVFAPEDSDSEFRQKNALLAKAYQLRGRYPGALDGQSQCALLSRNGDYAASACFTIYRRAFLEEHQLRFAPGLLHEDEIFTPICYAFAERAGCTNERCYGRLVHRESIMTAVNRTPSIRSYCLGAEILTSFLEEHPDLSAPFQGAMWNRIMNMNLLAARIYCDLSPAERRSCARSWAPEERDRIRRQLLPAARTERNRRIRVAVKARAPRPLWNCAKRAKDSWLAFATRRGLLSPDQRSKMQGPNGGSR